uniref:DUF4845 domain-containing protein n=1 Tax=uncultured bacterium UPO53 TaxID=1776978 RepID=A0A126SYD3_9BACT|nr:conserved hypothetical protein [uncultured bacterium UPO53]
MTVVLVLATIIKVTVTVGPAYYDYYTMDKIIISLFRDGRANSVGDFKRGLSDRLQINNIRDKSPDDFTYSFDSNSKKLVVDMDYEIRKPFVGNLDVIMHFKKTYSSELKADY